MKIKTRKMGLILVFLKCKDNSEITTFLGKWPNYKILNPKLITSQVSNYYFIFQIIDRISFSDINYFELIIVLLYADN